MKLPRCTRTSRSSCSRTTLRPAASPNTTSSRGQTVHPLCSSKLRMDPTPAWPASCEALMGPSSSTGPARLRLPPRRHSSLPLRRASFLTVSRASKFWECARPVPALPGGVAAVPISHQDPHCRGSQVAHRRCLSRAILQSGPQCQSCLCNWVTSAQSRVQASSRS
uniref:MAU2 sister chromatid cohesion factor n=1 Tax=Macaca fascicularis TaxID=9541 RepID=A0A7N9CNY6_MACFA